ncbi:unnamed protein product [Coregonus sp. 'balchen']|nr:unnamed protein product [Coregonus sp. 'balchen']
MRTGESECYSCRLK